MGLYSVARTYESCRNFNHHTPGGQFTASAYEVQGEWKTHRDHDRVDYPKAAYWRHDFAPASRALMNALAVAGGILLQRDFYGARTHCTLRDTVQVRIRVAS